MEKYEIKGGRALSGEIEVQRSKNAVLPILAASFLTEGDVIIEKCPKISDVNNMLEILEKLGSKYKFEGDRLYINSDGAGGSEISREMASRLRSSVFLLGPICAKQGRASVAYPGGCDIGARPVDIHIDGLKKLGVDITEAQDGITAKVNRLKGGKVFLRMPSVGATENIMITAAVSEGHTEIINAAKEPEIRDLQNFLNMAGAKIGGAGSSRIYIEGVEKLKGGVYLPIADRIEAGTFLIASAITGGDVCISGCGVELIYPLIDKLRNSGCKIEQDNDKIRIIAKERLKACGSIDTMPYPGFPTDLQAPMLALLTVLDGITTVTENIFETRFKHISELKKMGADISVRGNTAVIKGVKRLMGTDVSAGDLRGGAALVLAGLNADGVTTVSNIGHIARGYCRFDEKLKSLGAQIERF